MEQLTVRLIHEELTARLSRFLAEDEHVDDLMIDRRSCDPRSSVVIVNDLAAAEDAMDPYDARRYFGLPDTALPEALGRRVLSLTKTGVDFSNMSTAERAALSVWAVALGSIPPGSTGRFSWLTVRDDTADESARRAAQLVERQQGHDAAHCLANRLLDRATDRDAIAVLAAFGRRVYEGVERVVEHEADDLVGDDEDHYRRVKDQYTELADRTPGTWTLDIRTIRHAITDLATRAPELAAHLNESIVTGVSCCYEPRADITWTT